MSANYCRRGKRTPRSTQAPVVWLASLAALSAWLLLAPTCAAAASPASDPWAANQVIGPEQLARELSGPAAQRPLVVCVGFRFLYDSAHIKGAIYQGPAREPAGLKDLESAAQSWPHEREIVIYCGCCPMGRCPNVRPAFVALKQMGFAKLRVLNIPQDFAHDWMDKGYPVEKTLPEKGR